MVSSTNDTNSHSNGTHQNGSSKGGEGPLKVKRLTKAAFIPSRGSKYAAGYDLYSAYDCVVPARGKCLVNWQFYYD